MAITPTPIKPQLPAPNNPANCNSTVSTMPGVTGTSAVTQSSGTTPADWGASANVGVFGFGAAIGVQGSGGAIGVQGTAPLNNGIGVQGLAEGQGGVGILAKGAEYAGQFQGNVQITGVFTVTDPAGKHSIAGDLALGNVTTGALNIIGGATVNNLKVSGDATITGTLNVGQDIILAAPAGDCAEEFDVGTALEVEPGTVMVLDPTGALLPSEQSYDRKVAGVISGAGEYRPGLIFDRRDSPRRRVPIAVVGKVFVMADASYGPIEVGDLLTTSPTPGHAMKAGDPVRAFGAVIGKALRPLVEGQALIPILIALQ
jgi:hypothetical protein